MMMKNKNLLSTLMFFLIVGCNAVASSPVTKTIPSDSVHLANTAVPSSLTPFVGTPTSSPTLVSTDTPISGITTSCVVIENEETPLESVATGTIVLDKDTVGRLFLLGLQSSNEHEIPVQSKRVVYFGFQASPDRNLLAYVEGLQNNDGQFDRMILWIVNARAEVLEKITFNLPGLYNLRWLDNQSMIFQTKQTSIDGTVVFFKPFTREQRYISNELPDYYVWSNLVPRQNSMIEYAPNLEWGVYLGHVQGERLGFLVRDFISGQTAWQMADTLGEYQKPVWSPNGDEVAVVTGGHIYLVNREGQAYQVTNENQGNKVSHLSWSPDGKYLFYWNLHTLTIYDKQLDQVIDLCIENDYPDYPIWSPNSQQFVFGAALNESGILVDLQKMAAYKLLAMPDTYYPMEWMNSIP